MNHLDLQTARILLIDDQDTSLLLLEGLLLEGGYKNTIGLQDSRQAARVISQVDPDLILLDLIMPDVSGFELMAQLQPLTADQDYLPILVLTADNSPESKRKALASGAKDFLAKPLDAIEVLLRVKNLLETRFLYLRQRRMAVEKIREQAELIDRASDAILVLDMEDRISFWNRGAERIFGWLSREVLGRSADSLPFRAASPHFHHAEEVLRREGKWSGELPCVTKSGNEIVLDCRWTRLRDPAGQTRSTLLIATDITERRKLEQQLLRSQRVESVGLLASGIAHDLNNILSPIIVGAEVLKDSPDSPVRGSVLETLTFSARRGAELARRILRFAHGTQGRVQPIPPQSLIHEIAGIIRHTFPKSIEIRTHLDEGLGWLEGDVTQLHQVLLNLCINARDAMRDGGVLTLSARNVPPHSPAPGGQSPPVSLIRLSVADTGGGIPPQFLGRIFEPFFTTKGPDKGTGLGLVMVDRIVRAHGGTIDIDTRVGEGTSFHIDLPATAEDDRSNGETKPDLPSGNGELILLIDDELAIRQITAILLEAAGYRVLTARCGGEAISIYRDRREQIDLVLTNVMMPGMSGQETIQGLRELNPELRIVVATGTETAAFPAHVMLKKPYTGKQLLAAIRQVLRK